ncbi:MAG: hypothetical protein QNJ78_09950 [Gammaproteobacteria bacterium]|nr:hypothetical protein [Gammaproteobacteria bacterium]
MPVDRYPTQLDFETGKKFEALLPLIVAFLLLSLVLGTAWAQNEETEDTPADDQMQPSNIESWGEDEEIMPTWFGMGFESRKPNTLQPAQKSSDRIVNNW